MSSTSDKSRGIAFMLAIVLGMFGAHRFYVGKTGTGLLMLCTLGGLGIWYLYDVIMVASGILCLRAGNTEPPISGRRSGHATAGWRFSAATALPSGMSPRRSRG